MRSRQITQAALAFVCMLTFVRAARGEEVLVSVQSASQQDMDRLTGLVDQEAHSGTSRVTLGAIEATMSRVVNVEDPFLRTVSRNMPTLQLLDAVSFDSQEQKWTFRYKTARADASGELNDYNRILYFSRSTAPAPAAGDTRNPCVQANADDAQCLALMLSEYVLATGTSSPTEEHIEQTGACSPTVYEGCSIVSALDTEDTSAMQTLTVTIPHSLVRDLLSTRSETTSPLYGVQSQYTFGIGMLFLTAGNNLVIFDSYDILENSMEQIAISKRNSYAVARHVSFWMQKAYTDPTVRVATVEYLLDPGQRLTRIDAALNGRPINATDCAAMQAKIDALADPACMASIPLCQPSLYTTDNNGVEQVWATYVLPLPPWHTLSVFQVNTLLASNDTLTDTRVLSTLNFESQMNPITSCQPTKPVVFSPTEYVVAELFRGHALASEVLQGSFTVQNSTSPSMTEALMTVIIRPKDTDAAVGYFDSFTDETIGLDDVYMSHALVEAELPVGALDNRISGLPGGHTQLALDPTLLQACPMESEQTYSNADQTCVSTHDWTYDGAAQTPVAREVSSVESVFCPECRFFVRRVGDDAETDKKWLRDNIFGSGNADVVEAYYAQVALLAPARTRAHARIYWMSPLYAWPNRAPMGLEDRTIVSLAWSISKAGVQTRRLLELPHPVRKVALPWTDKLAARRVLRRESPAASSALSALSAHTVLSKEVNTTALYTRRRPMRRPIVQVRPLIPTRVLQPRQM